ncbi:CinA-like protein [Cytospora mali]|uniref:CinA-like protein n=1 Tax=Cytospora mali TaxID=578113 RepID=A0A194VJ42_CYTMA|nr:CinA-like protein [Valsa mali]
MAEFPPPALKQAAEAVSKILRDRNEIISVAETAAGGLISAALLATPGASRIYMHSTLLNHASPSQVGHKPISTTIMGPALT